MLFPPFSAEETVPAAGKVSAASGPVSRRTLALKPQDRGVKSDHEGVEIVQQLFQAAPDVPVKPKKPVRKSEDLELAIRNYHVRNGERIHFKICFFNLEGFVVKRHFAKVINHKWTLQA